MITDYWYEVTDEQIREHLSRSPVDRLRWLDEARRFTQLLHSSKRTHYRDGKPYRVEEAPGVAEPAPGARYSNVEPYEGKPPT
jgi:hypothetical protein